MIVGQPGRDLRLHNRLHAGRDGQRLETSAYGLEVGNPRDLNPPPRHIAARRRLARFAERMRDVGRWLPPGSIGEAAPHVADRFRVHVLGPVDPRDTVLERAWPLSTPLSEIGTEGEGTAG